MTGHNLGSLYAALLPEDKPVVEQEFMAFAWRYGGTPWQGVAEYLSSVAHDYVGWRYLLIELPRRDLSTTHPEALLAIAKGLLQTAKVRAGESPRSESHPRPERTATQSRGVAMASAVRVKKWREERYLVYGLKEASRRLKLHLDGNSRLVGTIEPDEPQRVSAWMAISCGYSLLEQAIKTLLNRRGDPRAEQEGCAGHDIDKLYECLLEKDKAVIERGFAVYVSLFDEIRDASASQFLRRVGSCYNEWRYLLIQRPRRPLSPMHPGALLEVAGLVIQILANETFTDHGMRDVARRLCDRIRLYGIDKALSERTLERHQQCLPQEAMTPFADWLREAPNLLSGYAAYLRGETPESELVADVLQRAQVRLENMAASPDGLDLRQFMKRSRDQARPLTWDAEKGLFARG